LDRQISRLGALEYLINVAGGTPLSVEDVAPVRNETAVLYILSPVIQADHIQTLSKGSASPHLNIGALRKFPIKAPGFDEQRQIVTELDTLRAKIDAIKSLQDETAAELAALVPSTLELAFKGQL
jgi:type I restriction enzyme, S subunit